MIFMYHITCTDTYKAPIDMFKCETTKIIKIYEPYCKSGPCQNKLAKNLTTKNNSMTNRNRNNMLKVMPEAQKDQSAYISEK